MSVRRRQQIYSDCDPTAVASVLQIGQDYQQLGRRGNTLALRHGGQELHPAITDFGPESLGDFVRSRVEDRQPQSVASQGTANNGFVSPYTRTQQPPHSSSETNHAGIPISYLQDLLARDALARESLRPARVDLAPNALHHLHGRSNSGQQSVDKIAQISKPSSDSPKKRRSSRLSRKTPWDPAESPLQSRELDDEDPFYSPPVRDPSTSPRHSLQSRYTRRRIGSGSTHANQSQASASIGVGGPLFRRTIQVSTTPQDPFAPSSPLAPQHVSFNASPGTTTGDYDLSTIKSFKGTFTNQLQTSVAQTGKGIVPYEYALIVPTAKPTIAVQQTPLSSSPKRKRLFNVVPAFPGDDDDDDDSDDDDSDFSDGGFFGWQVYSPNMKQLSISNNVNRRTWTTRGLPISSGAPPQCPLPMNITYQMPELPSDIWMAIASYLSLKDIHALRLVSRDISNGMVPIQFRNLVAPFGPTFKVMCASPETSILAKFGQDVAKFGISFEYDPAGLAFAPPKNSLKTEHAWYGSYQWPAQQYHRYESLKELEDLVDNNTPLLTDVFAHLSQTHELGLSVDSGHGWLEGPDISDMALFKARQTKGSRVFGQVFENEHAWQAYGRDEYFKWAQQNTLNKLLAYLSTRSGTADVIKMIDVASRFEVRDRESFRDLRSQPDFNPFSHTGGQAPATTNAGPAPGGAAAGGGPAPGGGPPSVIGLGGPPPMIGFGGHPFGLGPNAHTAAMMAQWNNNWLPQGPPAAQWQFGAINAHQAMNVAQAQPPPPPAAAVPTLFGTALQVQPSPRARRGQRSASASRAAPSTPKKKNIPLQWPLIFNGHNLAAESGGCLGVVMADTAHPHNFPFLPGCLTEAQVQYLMETIWAQRTFLSAYTGAILGHASKLQHVHTLTISKLSSGLLPSLAQPKFWDALPGLRRLTLLVSPDWRREHRERDVYMQRSSLVSPLDAVGKFASFLRTHICRLEKLYRATFGWVGGGEHAVGTCARNQHVLPAPIISDAGAWLSDHDETLKGDPAEMIKFEHLCDITFENCWFSPYMLETFMRKSHDTSLRTLTLKSVSMTCRHRHINATQQQPNLTTIDDGLACAHDEKDWLQEQIPASATWTEVLDRISPGKTLEQLKYEANLIDKDEYPMPKRIFRGRLQRIVLKSCGYVLLNAPFEKINQQDLVVHPLGGTDSGLNLRETILRGRFHKSVYDASQVNKILATYGSSGADTNKTDSYLDLGPVMLGCHPSSGAEAEWHGLGALTQCVHPIEKRVLEHAWGMKFGWGDDLERWAAVEDRQLEGGTGRFSGVILSDGLSEDDI